MTKYAYYMPVGVSSLTLLMSRAKFDRLPPEAQDILRQYGGEWIARHFVTSYGGYLDGLYVNLRADASRISTDPSQADMTAADAAFAKIVEAWSRKAPGNAALVQAARDHVADMRKTRQ